MRPGSGVRVVPQGVLGLGAISQETIGGFWPGDRNLREPAFYSYTSPEPEGLTDQTLRPEGAAGMALLLYENVRRSESPEAALLEFLESAYLAGAKAARWNVEDFRTGATH